MRWKPSASNSSPARTRSDRLLSREEGKPLANGIAETMRAAQIFKFFAQEALRVEGVAITSVRPGVDVMLTREPLGVVGLICPWNFPIAIPAWKMAPALAFGNTVVLKPADLVPGTAWALMEIISRAGLPKGVVNLVMGRGSVVGQTMLDSKDVNAISFTGSVETGARVAMACAKRGAKFQLEMGGKNPLVVLDDANLDAAVAAAIDGAFYQTGQRCTASSRLIVQKGIHDAFVDKMVAAMKTLKVDHALKDGTVIGPVVDEGQMAQDEKYIQIARDEGGELAWGGERLNRDTKGYYLSPALFVGTKNSMRINREEVFGPVASVIKVNSYEEGLAVANDTAFGLSSGIFTTSLKHATDFRKKSAGRHGDDQPADRGRRLPRALRRPEGFELRRARAGTSRGGLLHGHQDGLYAGLISCPAASAPRHRWRSPAPWATASAGSTGSP